MPPRVRVSQGGLAVCPPGSRVTNRVLADYEFVWVLDGDATWTHASIEQSVGAGTMILVQPGDPDAFVWDPTRPTTVAYAHFDVEGGIASLPPGDVWPDMVAV